MPTIASVEVSVHSVPFDGVAVRQGVGNMIKRDLVLVVFHGNAGTGIPTHQAVILLFDKSNGSPLAVMAPAWLLGRFTQVNPAWPAIGFAYPPAIWALSARVAPP